MQWKPNAQDYDTARQAVITDLNNLSYTISGLASGTGYSIRVAAVNSADISEFTDDDDRTRVTETTTTTG